MANFVGFYWTFPVRWVGFVNLPNDAARAAEASRTIAYQRALVHRYVSGEKDILTNEVVTMEVSPDRGTSAVAGDVERAGKLCRKASATLLYVDFQLNKGWRPHSMLADAVSELQAAGVQNLGLRADETMLKGQRFDPADHFSMWRNQDAEERKRRHQIIPAALAQALAEVPEGRGRWAKIARLLNEQSIPTLGGGTVWTAENVRKAVKIVVTKPVP